MAKNVYDPDRYLAASPEASCRRLAKLSYDKQLAKAGFVQKWLRRWFSSPPTIADVSCGSAYLSQVLDYARYIGVDHPDLLQHHTSRSSKVVLVPYDFESAEHDLDIGTLADLVISFETIEHLRDPGNLLAQIHKNLKPNGKLVLSTPNNPFHASVRYPDHIKEYCVDEIRDLLSQTGFRTDRVYALGIPFGLLTTLLRKRRVRVYRPKLDQERGLLSKGLDYLPLVRKVYCRVIPYRVAGIPIGDAGETTLLIAFKV